PRRAGAVDRRQPKCEQHHKALSRPRWEGFCVHSSCGRAQAPATFSTSASTIASTMGRAAAHPPALSSRWPHAILLAAWRAQHSGVPCPMQSVPAAPFATLLRQHRLARGLTQEELAERAHVSVQAIGALERGDRRAPRQGTVDLLAEALALTGPQHAAL